MQRKFVHVYYQGLKQQKKLEKQKKRGLVVEEPTVEESNHTNGTKQNGEENGKDKTEEKEGKKEEEEVETQEKKTLKSPPKDIRPPLRDPSECNILACLHTFTDPELLEGEDGFGC